MFELRLVQGCLLKKILESLKDLVNDANFDCSASGFSLQAMDSSHVALVALHLRAEGFEHFRCDRNLTMGMNIGNMAKMLKCAGNDDIVTIKAGDGTDTVTFMFENPSQDKISDFEMKLMDIDSENLGIPEAEYEAIVRMSSAEYARLCKDLSAIGDTVVLAVTKEGVRFSTRGDIGTANIVCRQNTSIDKPEDATIIEMKQPVTQTFALRYLSTFAKATPLSNQVTISLSSDLPAVVEYKIGEVGYLRFYLAPKIEEEDENAAAVQPETKQNKKTKTEVKKSVKTEVEPILVDESDGIEVFKPKLVKQPESEVEPILVEASQNGEECGTKVKDEPEKKSNGEVGSFMEIKTEECEVMDE